MLLPDVSPAMAAMRLFTVEEFESELIRRGCRKTEGVFRWGAMWQAPDKRFFMVPPPDEGTGRYPDWMLDDLIRKHRLPPAPTNH